MRAAGYLAATLVLGVIIAATLDEVLRPAPAPVPVGSAASPAVGGPASLSASSYTISLLAGQTRSGAFERIRIPSAAAPVRLQAEVENPVEGRHYDLLVSDEDGTSLQTLRGLSLLHAGRRQYVEALLAPDILGPGRRLISLRAQTPDPIPDEGRWSIQTEFDP
jgi:hypothetical protein